MENKYRIKIRGLNNGEKEYIPQVGIPKLNLGKYIHLRFKWENILEDGIGSFQITTGVSYIYKNEKDCFDVIERYKKYLIGENKKNINIITYKEL